MLINLLLLNLIAFSQKDTAINTKTFPIPIVRLIMKDLLSGDSAKAQLALTETQLLETERKVNFKDSIINTLRAKELNYVQIVDSERKKYDILYDYTKSLEKDLKFEKVKNKFKTTLGGTIIVLLGVLLIVK